MARKIQGRKGKQGKEYHGRVVKKVFRVYRIKILHIKTGEMERYYQNGAMASDQKLKRPNLAYDKLNLVLNSFTHNSRMRSYSEA